ncbi:hypothetical protein COO60DRAFT_1633044 [Scenedesmus sp. NREL 46B-D3]|nr:hypothetical protein COO60DRAFT_1633044 [Scenedesmus sp. NREL 46B-D3]
MATAAALLLMQRQLAQRQAQKGAVSFQSHSKAIVKALELARLHPHLDARDLLHPAIAEMQLSYVDRAVRRMRHVLPDTKLRAELLAKDPHEVSEQITRIVAVFKSRLGMQPPSQLLSEAWTFTKALRLPDQQLQAHLAGLLQLLGGDLAAAQRLAQQHAGVLLSSSFAGMLPRIGRLGQLLGLQQGHTAAEFALRHPNLLSSKKQLDKVESMLAQAPDALQLPLQQLLPCFVAHPSLFKYESITCWPNATMSSLPASMEKGAAAVPPSDLLALCAATSVRRAAGPGAVTESLNTAAAISGHSSPAALLPLLLQPPKLDPGGATISSRKPARACKSASASALAPAAAAAASSSSSSASWWAPAAQLRDRAAAVMQMQGLSRDAAAALLRWSPQSVLYRDPRTTHLKLVLLQRQLLGWEPAHSSARTERVAPELTKMLRRCPWVVNLQVETCSKRLAALQAALHLPEEVAGRLVLRLPQLLLLKADLLQHLVGELVQLVGGIDAARKLVLEDPKAAASRARADGLEFRHGVRGIRKKNAGQDCKWEMRSWLVYGKPKMYASWHTTALEAAAAFDLVKLAVKGCGAAVNLPASMYAAGDVAAVAALVQLKRQAHLSQTQQQLAAAADAGAAEHVKAGRQLLTLRPETGRARLQALAAVTGSSSSSLLSRGLRSSSYLGGVLGLTAGRLQDAALGLQQQLGLQEAGLQQLLQAAPSLLLLRSDTVQQKVALLLPPLRQLRDALQAAAQAAAGGGVLSEQQRQQQQQQQQQEGAESATDWGSWAVACSSSMLWKRWSWRLNFSSSSHMSPAAAAAATAAAAAAAAAAGLSCSP